MPLLIDLVHQLIAGARSLDQLDSRSWRERVEVARLDVLDSWSVDSALSWGVDTVLYLVHGMASKDFQDADARAARHVAEVAYRHGVTRIVYASGIIPDVPEEELSEHLRARLEVERILSASRADVVTLRAAMLSGLPEVVSGKVAGLVSGLPAATVEALIESLREDMFAWGDEWIGTLVAPSFRCISLEEAITRSLSAPDLEAPPSRRDPLAPLPGDWPLRVTCCSLPLAPACDGRCGGPAETGAGARAEEGRPPVSSPAARGGPRAMPGPCP